MILPSSLKKYQSTFIIAAVFAFSIFAQSVLFHYLIYHEILFSSLWHSPEDFFRFYLPGTTMAVFFASFVFLFKNRWWIVVVSMIFNLWIWANLWYYRANGVLLDHYCIGMIGNLNGFCDSLLILMRPIDLTFIILTFILIITIIITKNRNKSFKIFILFIVLSVILSLINGILLVRKNNGDWSNLNPIKKNPTDIMYFYDQDHSVIHQLILTVKGLIYFKEEQYTMTEIDISKINQFINSQKQIIKTKQPLIICLIESLNSFVITKDFMPNLQSFIDTSKNLLLCRNITSQIGYGGSSDGQMIVQTGLLPLKNGAACYRFCFNKYPALSQLYTSSTIILPHERQVWNQVRMNSAYGITNSLEKQSDNDKDLFKIVIQQLDNHPFVMLLTMSTHMPYTSYADSSNLILPDTVSSILNNYIKSANVLDKGMKILFDEIASNEKLQKSTIVITGDHCMPGIDRDNFNNAYGFSKLIPLIIYSPEIKEKTIVTDTCYQMDIYPTILNIIGCGNNYWKGFGVNLLDSTARHNRTITVNEAFELSDKIIRANFFNKIEQ